MPLLLLLSASSLFWYSFELSILLDINLNRKDLEIVAFSLMLSWMLQVNDVGGGKRALLHPQAVLTADTASFSPAVIARRAKRARDRFIRD